MPLYANYVFVLRSGRLPPHLEKFVNNPSIIHCIATEFSYRRLASPDLYEDKPQSTANMSLTQTVISPLPTTSAVGFVANLFRGTACIQEAFRQEDGGEFQYLENCWSDSAILQFILIGWMGLALKILLFVLIVTLLGACVQGRRPWYVFTSFVKGVGKVVGGLCSCFELDDEMRQGRSGSEAEKGLGIVWQKEKVGGGYFGSPKEKVRSMELKRNLTDVLTMTEGVIR